jgi:hypothetical protein
MAVSLATRIFSRIVAVPLKRPLLVLTVSGVLVAGAAYIASGLGVNTSRFGLVSASNPDQARMLRFYERFGNPDAPVMLVSGGEPAQRQQVVDAMTAQARGRSRSWRAACWRRSGPRRSPRCCCCSDPRRWPTS